MTQLKTISLKQTETIDPSTKQAGEKLIQILDTMFKSFGSIVYNASSLFATILYKNEKFGTSHLQALTHQSSWMDVPLSTFKRIVSKFMDGVYKNTSGKSINYYAYIETHGKKDMRNTFANKGLLTSNAITIAKALYKPGKGRPIESCYPKQHGRLVFSALVILSWISDTEKEFSIKKERLLTAVNPAPEKWPKDFKTYYESVDADKRDKPRLYLNIEELDNIVTEWAKATITNRLNSHITNLKQS